MKHTRYPRLTERSWQGAISPIVFIFVLVIALLMGAAGIGMRFIQHEHIAFASAAAQKQSSSEPVLYEVAEALLPVLYESLAPLPNSPHGELEEAMDGALTRILNDMNDKMGQAPDREQLVWKLKDISSRLPVNWVHPKLLDQDDLSFIFRDGAGSEMFRDMRAESGPIVDIQPHYTDLFSQDALGTLVTAYAPANINVSYPDSIRQLAELRSGDSSFADQLFEQIQEGLTEKTVWKERDMPRLLSPYGEELQGLVTTKGTMNVNYIPEEILRAVLYYPYGNESIAEFRRAYDEILTLRERQSVDNMLLKDMLSLEEVTEDHPLAERVLGYLGDRTWFWMFTLESGDLSLEILFVRLGMETDKDGRNPGAEETGTEETGGLEQTRFQIISQRMVTE